MSNVSAGPIVAFDLANWLRPGTIADGPATGLQHPTLSSVFEKTGAGEGIRTLDPNLGKVAKALFYAIQSYARIR